MICAVSAVLSPETLAAVCRLRELQKVFASKELRRNYSSIGNIRKEFNVHPSSQAIADRLLVHPTQNANPENYLIGSGNGHGLQRVLLSEAALRQWLGGP